MQRQLIENVKHGLAAGAEARPERAAGSGTIVDDHVLPDRRLDLLGKQARQHIVLPAGR